MAAVDPHTHRWLNTTMATLAGLTAVLTAVHEHQVVKLDVVPCEAPRTQGTVPTTGLRRVAAP